MATVVLVILIFLAAVALIAGALVAVLATRSAPEGFEDPEGFHVVGPGLYRSRSETTPPLVNPEAHATVWHR
jgi:hypothetical protein